MKPFRPFSEADRAKVLASMGLGTDLLPLNLTEAERLAAQSPGLPAPRRSTMEVTRSGVFTSEFWLASLMSVIVLPALAYFIATGGPLETIASTLAASSPVLALVVPLAAKVVAGLLGLAVAWLTSKYGQQRADLKASLAGTTAPAPVVPAPPVA